MVVFSVLCADFSEDFINFIPGIKIEEKVLSLQDKLGGGFPNVILQYLSDDKNKIIQIKGNYQDVIEAHTVLNAWNNGDIDEALGGTGKCEDIIDSVFFNREKPVEEFENDCMLYSDGVSADENPIVDAEKQSLSSSLEKHYEVMDKLPVEDVLSSRSSWAVKTKADNQLVLTESNADQEISTHSRDEDTDFTDVKDQNQITKQSTFSVTKQSAFEFITVEKIPDADGDVAASAVNTPPNRRTTRGRKRRSRTPTSPDDESNDQLEVALSTSPSELLFENATRGRKRKLLTHISKHEVDVHLEKALLQSKHNKEILCTLCDYKTHSKRCLKCHLVRCHLPGKFACRICKMRSYSLEKDLKAHMKRHFPKLQCSKCNKLFPTRTLRDLHEHRFHHLGELKRQKREEESLPHKCPQCDHIADNLKNLKDHIGRHHAEKQFECSVCSKRFGLKKDLLTHSKTHTDVYCCDTCGKKLRSKAALRNHVDAIHRGIKKQTKRAIICDHCGETFSSTTLYKDHLNREHLKVKPFGCPLCSMSFYSGQALKQHLQTHAQDRNFRCSVCAKTFKHSNSLKVHQYSHLQAHEKPYACSTCNKSFSQKGALIRHERIHTGEKPYKCRLCDSAFTDYSILRRHMLGVHKVDCKDLCQRDDVKGNRGGPKPNRVKVDNIAEYQNVVRENNEPVVDDQATVKRRAVATSKLSTQDRVRLQAQGVIVEERFVRSVANQPITADERFKPIAVSSPIKIEPRYIKSVINQPLTGVDSFIKPIVSQPIASGDSFMKSVSSQPITDVDSFLKSVTSQPITVASGQDAATLFLNKAPQNNPIVLANPNLQRDAGSSYTSLTPAEFAASLSLPDAAPPGSAAYAVMEPGGQAVDVQNLAYSTLPFTVQSVDLSDGTQNLAIQILQTAGAPSSLLMPEKS